jgi:hypothetical protein
MSRWKRLSFPTLIILAVSTFCVLLSFGILKPPETPKQHRRITAKDMLIDVGLFQTATLSYSFLVTSTSYSSGVGAEILANGSLSRGLNEFFSFWKYESRYQVHNVDPNKTKKSFFWHPLLGYEYTSYLMTKGYSKKSALFTSLFAIYIFEKGLQGSFETPSMYDFFSYASGISTAILTHELSRRLYEKENLLFKGVGLLLNPFFLIK